MQKHSETINKTKQDFIDAFCLLYSQKPLEKITVQEVTRKAGYNRSTFYQYFFDIDDLLTYVENELLDFVCEKRGQAGDGHNSFVEDLLEIYQTKSTYINAMMGTFGSSRFLESLKIESNLNMPELSLPDEHPFKPYLVEFHLSSTLSLFRMWLSRDKDLPIEELITLLADLYNGAINKIDIPPTR